MFVSRLDRDWVGTPFPFQGFFIETDAQLELLAAWCTSVFVDVERGPGPDPQAVEALETGPSGLPRGGKPWVDTADLLEELPRALAVRDEVHALASRLIGDVREGRQLSGAEVREAMEHMVGSLLRNADAMFWLVGLMKRDDYAYSHAVNCSALATALGRQLALPREVLVELATGGLLLDIGKARVPETLFNHHRPLSTEGRRRIQSHVEEGLRTIEAAGIGGTWVREMIAGHHERHDGGGYPRGQKGLEIPLAGRIGALADTYDALTSSRPHKRAVSRHEALQTIYRAGNQLFQGELVEQFMQALGVYPTGSLVELSTGQVGIVMAQNQARRLRPRVMLLLTADKERYQPFRDVDLMTVADERGGPVTIVAALEPGAYGLNPSDLYLT
ncbi:hypothetical protein P873_14140 [Arenimonas composti TR7-09 = DSM 18010]|uniref:HD-GYP domain-containing protein n=2 Tax=Arenimonas TaxID=490567 RepID=A0A091BWA7_9GAMM|nr:hypothetical protein P873_14140 [Arenimonas composti TR7-09 = DSM 18010]